MIAAVLMATWAAGSGCGDVLGQERPAAEVSASVRSDEQRLTEAVQRLLREAQDPARTTPCRPARQAELNLPSLGRAEQICVFGGNHPYVTMMRGSSPFRGLLYDATGERPPVKSQCLRALYGPWWEVSELVDASCPDGFEVVGGA